MHYIIILHILSAENMYSVYCTKKIIVYKQIKSMVPPAMSLFFFFCSRNYQLLKVQSAKKSSLIPSRSIISACRVTIHFTVRNKQLLLLDPQSLYSCTRMNSVFFCLAHTLLNGRSHYSSRIFNLDGNIWQRKNGFGFFRFSHFSACNTNI